jgi:tetratricopeptide (TPR) repeat protein
LRSWIPGIAAVLALLIGGPAEAADNRVALVVGNASYRHAAALPTPANDAEDIAATLTRIGFDVDLQKDTSAEALKSALGAFAVKSAKADVAIVYFAGYSVNAGIDGYLIPVDAQLASASSFRTEAIPLRAVMADVARARLLGLLILDALRGNPFPAKFERQDAGQDSNASAGTAASFKNVLVFFATEPTRKAEEGDGRNSPLAAALLKYLPEPDLEISFLFRKLRDEVRGSTGQKQTPYMYGQLSRDKFYLNAVNQAAVSMPTADPAAVQPCDRLAAAPEDTSRSASVRGIKLEEIKTSDAIAACSEAVRQFPGIDRFHYQLGRALFAAQDYPSALASYKKAFELGNTRALYALGAMYDNGNGVEKDPARARFYYEVAAEMKFAPAIVSLGIQQERGIGGEKDLAKAYSLYRRAADLGDGRAVNKLGELTEKGLGVAANAGQARALYEKSAAMGEPDAMINLARCYANGIGGRQDTVEARKLLARAAQAGSTEAKEILARVGKNKRK